VESRIIELDLEITKEISKGHRPYYGDFLEEQRQELSILRCIFFGYNSKYCKNKKGFHGTPFS